MLAELWMRFKRQITYVMRPEGMIHLTNTQPEYERNLPLQRQLQSSLSYIRIACVYLGFGEDTNQAIQQNQHRKPTQGQPSDPHNLYNCQRQGKQSSSRTRTAGRPRRKCVGQACLYLCLYLCVLFALLPYSYNNYLSYQGQTADAFRSIT